MAKKNTAKNVAIGTAIAGLAGYVAGILTAPKSGKETRKDIKDTTAKGITAAEKELKHLHTELGDVLEKAKTKGGDVSGKAKKELDKVVGTAKTAKEKAREMLSAIHEGDAEDKELKKAVKDAKKSIEHLKSYLKK